MQHPQEFPIYYPASAQFKAADGNDAGAGKGATASLAFSLSTRPAMLTGIRMANVYEIPEDLRNVDGIAWLEKLDGQQQMSTDMEQQNIVIKPTLQDLVTGRKGYIWHPFEQPYPFKGGNNITVPVSRLISYPDSIVNVTVYATLVGWSYVDGQFPPAGPPSTGFPTGQ